MTTTASYRTFTKTGKVLALLLEKFENLRNTEAHKKTLLSVLHLWLDAYPEDWDDENLQTLLTFTSGRMPNSKIHMKALNKFTERLDKYARVPPLSWNDPSLLTYQSVNDLSDQFNGLCLSPAFRGTSNSHLITTYRFPNISVKHFAEQLTRMDMELFKRLIPHQCLGETWSHRDKVECGSVLATVAQFNAVSYRVISTILIEPKLKPQVRNQKQV
jgi:ral guanine nucleotide dissociation stimulator-like 1